jgi:hypothetical protein
MIQKITAHYLSSFDGESLLTFIEILKLFVKITESKNYRYGIIEYFYAISDHISKHFMGNKLIWLELFSFLNINSEEKDPEIRNSSLNIFAGIINNYGSDFTPEIWQQVMEDIYLKSFDKIFEVYFNLLREEIKIKSLPDTPEYILSLKDDFDLLKKAKE